jgi:cysteinyl-tRNA synthetase
VENCEKAIKDDLSTATLISHLFEGVRITNSIKTGVETISKDDLARLNRMFEDYAITILGFQPEAGQTGQGLVDPLMELILDIREDARANKNFDISDKIRDALKTMKINTKDEKDGTSWTYDG